MIIALTSGLLRDCANFADGLVAALGVTLPAALHALGVSNPEQRGQSHHDGVNWPL